MARAPAPRGFFPITAAPIAPNPGEKPAQHFGSHQNAPGRTPHEPTASRAVHQDPAGGVGVFDGFPELRRAEPLVAALSGDL